MSQDMRNFRRQWKWGRVARVLLRPLFKEWRTAVVVRTATMSIVARGSTILLMLVSVPLVLNHIGVERYGVWTAALALATIFGIADGGVSVSMVSPVANAHGAGEADRIRVIVASAFVATTATCVVLIFTLLVVASLVDWAWLFNVADPQIGREAAQIFVVLGCCYALSFPASVIRQARLGLLQGPAVSAWDFAGTVLTLIAVMSAVALGSGLVGIAAAWAGIPALVRWVGAIVFLAGEGRHIMPRCRDISVSVMKSLLLTGGSFLLVALTQIVSIQSDQLLIARLLGAAAVTDYAILQRLFGQVQVVFVLIFAAQWPAYGEAVGRGDYKWIRQHFRVTLFGAILFGISACFTMAFAMDPLLRLWIGSTIKPSQALVFWMALYGVISAVANVFAYFFFALGLSGRVLLAYAAMIPINISLALLLIPRIGSPGACIATSFGYMLALIVPSALVMPSLLRNLPALQSKAPT